LLLYIVLLAERSDDRKLRPIVLQRRVDLQALGSIKHFIDNLQDIPNIPNDFVGESQSTIPEAGVGLFAKKDIKKGEKICEYIGKKIRRVPKDARYCIKLRNGMYVDAIDPNSGHGRFSNDSLHKLLDNAEFVEDFANTVFLEATRDIKAGEEIFCSYGWEYYLNEDLDIHYRRQGVIRYWSDILPASTNPLHRSSTYTLAKIIGTENEIA